MRSRLTIPIRVKFMITFLVLVTGVVGLITFSTANLFQDDKEAYVRGLTSMIAVGAADEVNTTMSSYLERLQFYTEVMADGSLTEGRRDTLSHALFDDFPELVAVRFHLEDTPPMGIYNQRTLESAGLTREQFEELHREHPLPTERIRDGQPFVRNTTLSKEFPSFTLAFLLPVEFQHEPIVASAVIRADRLLQVARRFSAYNVFVADSEGTLLIHPSVDLIAERPSARLAPEARQVQAEHSAGITLEYETEGVRTIGGFASVDFAGLIAAAEIPRSAAYVASQRLMQRLLVVAAVLLVLAILMGFVWALRITRPVERLADATRQIARGDFDIKVASESRDEIGNLASSFNRMTSELKQREDELHAANSKLIQSEKMAAFGQLGAGIAHEVKNPLAGILACAQIAREDVDDDSQLHDDLGLIEKETKRCKTIIDNLLKFARQEQAQLAPTQINTVAEDSIAIVNHQMELNKITVEHELAPDLPPVYGNANQLQQVFMNLLINAQQAMEGEPGTVRIETAVSELGRVEIRVTDTGPGIPDSVQEKLFEPFFTTKPTGTGTGLGLSVSYGIIRDHQGEITVESEVGKGTTFVISLPAIGSRSDQVPATDAELVDA
jgi:signal transduction histidine kinase